MPADKQTIKTEFGLKYDSLDISKYITRLRTEQKMTRYQLALCAGVQESVLMRIEKGLREPRLNTLLKIIEGLDLKPSEFWREFN